MKLKCLSLFAAVSLFLSCVGVLGADGVRAEGAKADKINIEIVFDVSTSMKGDKLRIAKQGINEYLDAISGNENINIAFRVFSSRKRRSQFLIFDFAPATEENIADLKGKVNKIWAIGDTGIGWALNLAAGDFEGLKGSNEIILVTDGENTCGPDPCKVVETVLREKRIKVRIDVVTIELNPEIEKTMSCIYEPTGGELVSIDDVGELGAALRKVTTKFEEEVAEKEPEPEPVDEEEPWEIYGAEAYKGWTDVRWTGTADILMGSLTYGYKIKVPTKKVKGWSPLYGEPREVVKEGGECQGSHRYRGYDFGMEIGKPWYYESTRMADKFMQKKINGLRSKVDEGKEIWNLRKPSGHHTYFKSMEVKEKLHIIAHLFNIALEEGMEGMIEELNQAKIPGELREAFQNNNCPLTGKAKAEGAEDGWLITDGIEMYSVEKSEEQLKVYSCCKATGILFTDGGRHILYAGGSTEDVEKVVKYYYIQKGPVVYFFDLVSGDMIYEDFDEKYFKPMLATFEPIVVITEPTQ